MPRQDRIDAIKKDMGDIRYKVEGDANDDAFYRLVEFEDNGAVNVFCVAYDSDGSRYVRGQRFETQPSGRQAFFAYNAAKYYIVNNLLGKKHSWLAH